METSSLAASSALPPSLSYVAELSEVYRILNSVIGTLGENLRMGDIPAEVRRRIIRDEGNPESVKQHFQKYLHSVLSAQIGTTGVHH